MFEFGIGITTRNRPQTLAVALRHFKQYMPTGFTKIIVIDDASTPEHMAKNCELTREVGVAYSFSAERQGIAGAKNRCLRHLACCKHIFLFDDDCFPARPEWWDVWLAPGFGHLTFSMDLRRLIDAPSDSAHLHMIAEGSNWEAFSGALGCCLYLQNKTLDRVGGYDPRFGIYGYEHAQYSKRCHKAGLCPHEYTAPKGVLESIYSIDMHHRWLNQKPPLDCSLEFFDTSVTREEADKHVEYAHLMQDLKIKIPLEGLRCELESE